MKKKNKQKDKRLKEIDKKNKRNIKIVYYYS